MANDEPGKKRKKKSDTKKEIKIGRFFEKTSKKVIIILINMTDNKIYRSCQ